MRAFDKFKHSETRTHRRFGGCINYSFKLWLYLDTGCNTTREGIYEVGSVTAVTRWFVDGSFEALRLQTLVFGFWPLAS